ncbi:hypothetical protein KY290_013428 [Solanum tuberosum]|uniref:DUF4283 domain-containing protein n=1 Tax=Solanum tuberosum TaxID=4113 RepID=A0ABQ7VLM3_SOLTU|nr:hypothetical protein KY285_012890 [Solanum tuberosum]KAH0769447.1 hypothetical protein KY290_013428 [Solanum tuberosum]
MTAMATDQPPPGEVRQTQGPLEEKKISYANTLVAPKTQHQSLQIKPLKASLLEDYVKLLSKPQFYIIHNHWSYPMRTLKWDPLFDPEEETTTTIAWISFPSLSSNFFCKEIIFSMAAAVGRPLQNCFHKMSKQRRKDRSKGAKMTRGEKGDQADGKGDKGKKHEHGDGVQHKAVTQQEENRRESETGSSNFHLKEDNIGLEQIDRSKHPIDKDTGSNDTQLEARKSMVDKKKERGKVNALELEIEDDLSRKEAYSFITPRIDKKKPQDIQEKLDTVEEENMDANIHCISREGDLSPRQIVKSQNSFERLLDLNRKHHYSYIDLLAPFQSPSEMDRYMRRLGKQNAKFNCSSKIWLFWDDEWEELDCIDLVQQITISFKHRNNNAQVKITSVYARCSSLERLELWDDLEEVAYCTNCPWLVGGDFNTITDESEKLGGLHVSQIEVDDFVQCISSGTLNEIKFSGSCYTW